MVIPIQNKKLGLAGPDVPRLSSTPHRWRAHGCACREDQTSCRENVATEPSVNMQPTININGGQWERLCNYKANQVDRVISLAYYAIICISIYLVHITTL
jgi:hypothetical protein